ncbi:MAG TPA: hypothetical protein IAB46_02060 [Candidatus Scybalocola faecigallinarum]|uniref:Uncharacterized protein n=1 Tax=Candidatus Scybalocola faecigallinarum TaxID=2840941 RepID=A0A9D1F3A4_9FIRM|nr:hypothetical protein [Candidatus Scybalocola faecigallinarum]
MNTFEDITIKYSSKLVQITCDETLKDYLDEKGNGALKLSGYILEEYKKCQGKPLKISKDSLAIEILAHTYIDSFSQAISAADKVLPAALRGPLEKLMDNLRSHTGIIDCGETAVDNNRWIWDMLTPYKGLIYGALGDRA